MSRETKVVLKNSHIVDGFKLPAPFSPEAFRSAVKYRPRDDDVFIVTYPKCGTTWAQHILILIYRHGVPESPNKIEVLSPFLELKGAQAAEDMPRPGIIKTHLPFQLAPRSERAKYIYIVRNPKDCCVSFFHHMRDHHFEGTFDDFFELFIAGETYFGDYFDHLLSWYGHRNDSNVLFLTYEEMKKDSRAAILKMASFIDDKLYADPLRECSEKLNNVIKYSSFQYMKDVVNKSKKRDSSIPEFAANSELNTVDVSFVASNDSCTHKPRNFIRKGVVGDWKNYFSEEQCKRLDEKFAEKTKGTDIFNWWKDYM